MKRSYINQLMRQAVALIDEMRFSLPPFARWDADTFRQLGAEYQEIRDNLLGWDITDFGSGDFERIGLLLFTLRNGNAHLPQYTKPYAEKLMIVKENQVTPMHYHYQKMEDIINRGGGNLLITLYNAAADDGLDTQTPVCITTDGRRYSASAGTVVRLTPGESITLPAGLYHSFRGEPGRGTVLAGEVSTVNDDHADNRFLEPVGRFPEIEEDEPPLFLMCKDYS